MFAIISNACSVISAVRNTTVFSEILVPLIPPLIVLQCILNTHTVIAYINSCSFFFRLTVKLMKGSSRIIIVLALSMCLVGCVLISDWQAIGGSTCFNHRTDANESYYNELSCTNSNTTDNSTDSQIMEEMCKAKSPCGHHCFWNPHSRITGDYCNTCIEKCLSYETSLNFYQFNVGVFLVMSGSILEFVFNLVLVSELFPAQKQVK